MILMLAISVYTFGQVKSNLTLTEKKADKRDNVVLNIKPSASAMNKAVGDIIWQDDFSTPSNWSFTNETGDCQNWGIFTSATQTALYGISAINSTTAANGYACFNSDYVGTQCGNDDAAPAQLAHMTTATSIDLSAYTNVAIVFEENYRRWQDTTQIGISTDGSTWTYISANPSIATGGASSTNPQVVNLNISSQAGGQATVWIRFTFRGDWDYAWMVDDVKLVVSAQNEINLETPFAQFYGSGFYSNTPASQIMNVTLFSAAIHNNGTLAQTGINLNVKINDGTSVLHDVTGSILANNTTSLAAGQRDTVFVDTTGANLFTPPYAMKNYTAIYNVIQTETDEDLSNNFDTLKFNVTDTVFARDVAYKTYTGPARYTSGVDGDAVGTAFYFTNDDEVRGISVYIPAFATITAEGTSFIGKILLSDGAGGMVEKVATDVYTVTANDVGTWVTVPFIYDGSSEMIAADTYAYAMIECYWQGTTGTLYIGADDAPYHDYEASTLLILGGSNYWISRLPMVRLNVKSSGVVAPVALTNSKEINVYPNPTNGLFNVTNVENATINVYNVLGERVISMESSKAVANLDLSNLANGTYVVKVATENTVTTKQVQLVK